MKYALAEMKDAGIEEMALGIELENVLLEAGLRDILVDLDGLFVLLRQRVEVSNLQKTLLSARNAVLALEIVGSLLVVLHALVGLVVVLVHFADFLLQLSSVGEAAHIAEEGDGLLI